MKETFEPTQSEEDSSAMAILKRPQYSTSVTKFAGPYINSIVFQQNEEIEEQE